MRQALRHLIDHHHEAIAAALVALFVLAIAFAIVAHAYR